MAVFWTHSCVRRRPLFHPTVPPVACTTTTLQRGLTWTVRIPGGGPAVSAAQLQHRVPCWGYVFQEPAAQVPAPAAVGVAMQQHQHQSEAEPEEPVAAAEASGVEAGSAAAGGRWVRRGRKLVILGDTCDSAAIGPLAVGADLLSHEATFCCGAWGGRGGGPGGGGTAAGCCCGQGWAVCWMTCRPILLPLARTHISTLTPDPLLPARLLPLDLLLPVLPPACRHGGQGRHRPALDRRDGGRVCGRGRGPLPRAHALQRQVSSAAAPPPPQTPPQPRFR